MSERVSRPRNEHRGPEFNPAVNPSDAPPESGRFRNLNARRRFGAFALLLLCASGIWWLKPTSALPPEVTVLPPDYSIPAPPLPVPDRWIPMTWGWLWHLRYAVLGKPTVVDVETRLIRFREMRTPQLQELLNGSEPFVSSNGVRAWIIPETEIKSLGLRLELPDSKHRIGGMNLGLGVLATMSMTVPMPIQGSKIFAGDTVTYAVCKHGDSVELTGTFISTEMVTNDDLAPVPREVISLHTNLNLAARMQVLRGQSVFLYDTNRAHAQNSGVGLLIQAKVQ